MRMLDTYNVALYWFNVRVRGIVMTVVTVTLVRITNVRVLNSAQLVKHAHFSWAQWSVHSSCAFGTLSANALTSVICIKPVERNIVFNKHARSCYRAPKGFVSVMRSQNEQAHERPRRVI
jgi:hypothetical protein